MPQEWIRHRFRASALRVRLNSVDSASQAFVHPDELPEEQSGRVGPLAVGWVRESQVERPAAEQQATPELPVVRQGARRGLSVSVRVRGPVPAPVCEVRVQAQVRAREAPELQARRAEALERSAAEEALRAEAEWQQPGANMGVQQAQKGARPVQLAGRLVGQGH